MSSSSTDSFRGRPHSPFLLQESRVTSCSPAGPYQGIYPVLGPYAMLLPSGTSFCKTLQGTQCLLTLKGRPRRCHVLTSCIHGKHPANRCPTTDVCESRFHGALQTKKSRWLESQDRKVRRSHFTKSTQVKAVQPTDCQNNQCPSPTHICAGDFTGVHVGGTPHFQIPPRST